MRTANGIERWAGFPYPLWTPASLRRLARNIRCADAVHVHDAIYAGSFFAAWLARRYGKPLVVTQHIGTVPLPGWLRPVLAAANWLGAQLVLKRARAVAFISPAVRRHFEGLLGACPHFHDVPNGVDHGLFFPASGSPASLRADLGFDPSRPLMVFVGRFVAKKRLGLVRQMAQLRPDWQWCVIGQGPEQPEAWGLPNVRVMPPMLQAALAAYYRAADLLVLPSEGEGFPLVVQEAMSCGLPACITADVAAGSTMPADLWLALRERPGRTAELGVEAIDAWLSQPEAARWVQRAACSAYASDTWSWAVAADRHAAWLAGAVS
jgi:glycosyltransferase involved in cell wall biosynthesis